MRVSHAEIMFKRDRNMREAIVAFVEADESVANLKIYLIIVSVFTCHTRLELMETSIRRGTLFVTLKCDDDTFKSNTSIRSLQYIIIST